MSFPLISEKLAELRRGARYDSSDPNFNLEASQIERVAKRLKAKFGASDVETVCPGELRDRWYALLSVGERFELSQRELRMLSWYADVGTSPQFIGYLVANFSYYSPGPVLPTITAF